MFAGMNPANRTMSALLGLGLLSLAAACDESAENRKPGPAAAPPAATAPAAAKAADKPAPSGPAAVATPPATPPTPPADTAGIVRAYSGCYADCFTEKASATNRETCKLTCDGAAEASLAGLAGAPPKDEFMKVISTFNGCVNACYDDKTLSATNRSTCVLTCQDAAEVSASAPPKAAGTP